MIQGTGADLVSRERVASELAFPQWDKARKVVDELIDLSLNYRQSGHPGGSRSKVHLLIATLRWRPRAGVNDGGSVPS